MASDQQTSAPHADADHRPRHGGALRHRAAADRRHALRRLRPAPGGAVLHPAQQYHVVLEVDPELPGAIRPRSTQIYVKSPATGQQVPLSAFVKFDTRQDQLAVDQPPGPVPGGDAVLQPRARASRSARRSTRSSRPSASSACRPTLRRQLPGHRPGVPGLAATQPYLIAAALVVVYIILGMLYESYIHPLTILSTLPSAGVGALLILMAVRLRSQRHRADRHHPADRHRQEERHHDGRLRARGRARPGPDAGRGDPPGLPAALPPDHDDDDGGAARRPAADARPRHRLRAAPAARLRHRRRPAAQPGADALHDAGRLSLPRPVEPVADRAAALTAPQCLATNSSIAERISASGLRSSVRED